jgi:hypothetical protein
MPEAGSNKNRRFSAARSQGKRRRDRHDNMESTTGILHARAAELPKKSIVIFSASRS